MVSVSKRRPQLDAPLTAMRRGAETGKRSSVPCPALPERAAKAALQDSACGAIAFRLA